MAKAAPSVTELRQHPVVIGAIEAAWRDSLPEDPENRHEEGRWIYMELATGIITVERALRGRQRSIGLLGPPLKEGNVIVGIFHTHPNPTNEGWDPEPSDLDRQIDEKLGVPDLVRSDHGLFESGPTSRRGGLSGPPGFPD